MAAPTNAAIVKKTLANPEPSTHGPERRSLPRTKIGRKRRTADIAMVASVNRDGANDPKMG
jgi:hypothetical protein